MLAGIRFCGHHEVEEVEEAERSGGAAQRLLSVTCDAFARLNDDLRTACQWAFAGVGRFCVNSTVSDRGG